MSEREEAVEAVLQTFADPVSWVSRRQMAEYIVELRHRADTAERERDGWKHRAERAERVVEAARAHERHMGKFYDFCVGRNQWTNRTEANVIEAVRALDAAEEAP